MFEFFGVWSKIKGQLQVHANRGVYRLLSKLKAARASTVADLAAVVADKFSEAGFSKRWTQDKLVDPRDSDEAIVLHSLPMSDLASSPIVAQHLARSLKSNTDLQAAKNALAISDADWDAFIDDYAASFSKFAMPLAVKRLLDMETPVYVDEFILAVAEGEAYEINGVATYHDMVKLYAVPSHQDRKAKLKKARRYWKRRLEITYRKNI